MSNRQGFIKRVTNPFLFRLYTLKQIPMLMLAGIKIVELGDEAAITSIRYGYLTKNPFRSIYFACLGMAAELSSGAIAMMYVSDSHPRVSMLVTSLKADFMKKATGRIFFSCDEGKKIADAIAETQKSGEGVSVVVLSKGTDEKGDVVAEFSITWSFRRKSN